MIEEFVVPIYEFVCRKCKHTFETLVQDGEETECPHCQATQLERLLSLPARPVQSSEALSPCMADPSLPPCGPACRRAQ
jgi:putative FmdB family regulatory protein